MALWSISGAANRSFSMVNQADKFPNDVGLESCIIMHNDYLSSGGFEMELAFRSALCGKIDL
jgi:hypothetical protein